MKKYPFHAAFVAGAGTCLIYFFRVMCMDRVKTGELIAAARKGKGLTQRELAQKLHVSDRAVSKWERGAGFPDVSLLEPLAGVLELQVLDLLRGERTADMNADAVVSETLAAVQEKRQQDRREAFKALLSLLPALVALWCLLGLFGMLRLPVSRTVTAGVYQMGEMVAVTDVQVKGWVVCGILPWNIEYQGKLITPVSEKSDLINYHIAIQKEGSHPHHKSWSGNIKKEDRPFVGSDFCLTAGMKDFAFNLTDGRVIATSYAIYERFSTLYHAAPIKVIA